LLFWNNIVWTVKSDDGRMTTTIKYMIALDGRRSIILYTTTNQKHAETAYEGMDRRWDRAPPPGRHLRLFGQEKKHQVLFSDKTSHA
jgi:hypothetical protein